LLQHKRLFFQLLTFRNPQLEDYRFLKVSQHSTEINFFIIYKIMQKAFKLHIKTIKLSKLKRLWNLY
jgi:hypothetical protein